MADQKISAMPSLELKLVRRRRALDHHQVLRVVRRHEHVGPACPHRNPTWWFPDRYLPLRHEPRIKPLRSLLRHSELGLAVRVVDDPLKRYRNLAQPPEVLPPLVKRRHPALDRRVAGTAECCRVLLGPVNVIFARDWPLLRPIEIGRASCRERVSSPV